MSSTKAKIIDFFLKQAIYKSAAGPLTQLVIRRLQNRGQKTIRLNNALFAGVPEDYKDKTIPVTIYYFGSAEELASSGHTGILMAQPPKSTENPNNLAQAAFNSFISATNIKPAGYSINIMGFSAGGDMVAINSVNDQKTNYGSFSFIDGFHADPTKNEKGDFKSAKMKGVAERALAAATDPKAPAFVMTFSHVIASGAKGRYPSTFETAQAIINYVKSKGVQLREDKTQRLTNSGAIIDYYGTAGKLTLIGTHQDLPEGYETNKNYAYDPNSQDPAKGSTSMGAQHIGQAWQMPDLIAEEKKRFNLS
jgi:hypothetical protein